MNPNNPVTLDRIYSVTDSVCRDVSSNSISFRQQTETDPPKWKLCFRFHGIEDEKVALSCSFYLAYSTWDGVFMFLDELLTYTPEELSKKRLASCAIRTLARVAADLGCSRLTWRTPRETPLLLPSSMEPSFMKGWLTVFWEEPAMQKFVETKPSVSADRSPAAIQSHLDSLAGDTFKMRLASEADVDDIMALVQGLALYEKEPDAVNTTPDVYRADGFGSHPLFHCILLDHVKSKKQAIGMAFYYVAESRTDGNFIYLEDLFISKEYRKAGGGTALMKALATISLATDQNRLIWQVLDWNQPAIGFYEKIGATIHQGLDTHRYEREQLLNIAKSE